MKRLCKNFTEHVIKINNYEKKEMMSLTDEETKSYENQKVSHICKKEFSTGKSDKNEFNLYHKVRDQQLLIVFVI